MTGALIGLLTGFVVFRLLIGFCRLVTSGEFSVPAALYGAGVFLLPPAVLLSGAFLLRDELAHMGIGMAAALISGALGYYFYTCGKRKGRDTNND